jgi:ribose/xylose/arabinose/galactoside ABC-type transport system permease subunit
MSDRAAPAAWSLPFPHSSRGRLLLAIRAAALLALAAAALTTPGFFSTISLFSLLNSVSLIGCVAVGMTFITLSGNILSFALGATLSACAIIFVVAQPLGLPAAALAAALTGAVLMGVQGWIIGTFRANAIIVSMAALALIIGTATLITGGAGIYPDDDSAEMLKGWLFDRIPISLAGFLLTAAIAQFVLSNTSFGRTLMMVGSNWRASMAAGLAPERAVLGAYIAAGLCAAVAGILMAARYSTGDIGLGQGYDYSAISAVLVGGTAIQGGESSVLRSVVGAFIIAICQALLVLHGFSTQVQYLAIGLIVLGVIMLQTLSDDS